MSRNPGVYLFRNKDETVLYVGKAKNLRNRLRSYCARATDLPPKTAELVRRIASFSTISTASEFDALLLEARLIASHKPKYNIISRDDRSPLYIVVTLSKILPEVLFVRKTQLATRVSRSKKDLIFGPFQSSRITYGIMADIRRVIPFCREKTRAGKPCFYTHLGLCDPCPCVLAKAPKTVRTAQLVRQYRKNLYRIARILDGKSTSLVTELAAEMQNAAKQELFEKALLVRKRLAALAALHNRSYDPSLYLSLPNAAEHIYENQLSDLMSVLKAYYPGLTQLKRIEAIDISQLSGNQAVGSLVVLANGSPAKSEYRRFRIRSVRAVNDTAMIAEVLKRRLGHPEWDMPDLLLVDGGKPQLSAAQRVLAAAGMGIPVAGLAKRNEEIIVPGARAGLRILRLPFTNPGLQVLLRIRDEAHRFGITYHRLLRRAASGLLQGKV